MHMRPLGRTVHLLETARLEGRSDEPLREHETTTIDARRAPPRTRRGRDGLLLVMGMDHRPARHAVGSLARHPGLSAYFDRVIQADTSAGTFAEALAVIGDSGPTNVLTRLRDRFFPDE